jgi:hypothetical protein
MPILTGSIEARWRAAPARARSGDLERTVALIRWGARARSNKTLDKVLFPTDAVKGG